ncbi:MAG: carbohydrate porin, partial [Okeania sp. SIO2H7]|nr:carbohydrate porin [Okeania sp. SIO2H7]
YKPGDFAFGDGTTLSIVGTSIANTLNGFRDDFAVNANAYGIQTFFQFSPKVAMSGWVGLTDVRLIDGGDAEIWNYAVTLVFPDLGKEGNLGALIFGAQPTLRSLEVPGSNLENRDFSYHLEASYKFLVSDNISITPGVFWLPSLDQNSDSEDLFIWVVRTTFKF